MATYRKKQMEFKKNNNGNGTSATVIEAPKVVTPITEIVKAPTPNDEPTPNALIVERHSVENQFTKVTSLKEVFEHNDAITRKREAYNEFCKRLDELISFRESHNGSGLKSTFENEQGGKVTITNLKMNLAHLDDAISQGKKAKEQIEFDILNSRI